MKYTICICIIEIAIQYNGKEKRALINTYSSILKTNQAVSFSSAICLPYLWLQGIYDEALILIIHLLKKSSFRYFSSSFVLLCWCLSQLVLVSSLPLNQTPSNVVQNGTWSRAAQQTFFHLDHQIFPQTASLASAVTFQKPRPCRTSQLGINLWCGSDLWCGMQMAFQQSP